MGDRIYQADAENRTFNWLYNSTSFGGVIAMPTGTGKSHVIARITRRVFRERPNAKVQMLTHRKPLIQQNADKLLQIWPEAPLGIFSAGLKQKTANQPITFGGIASMKNAINELTDYGRKPVDLVKIDECHLLNPNADTMYMEYLELLKKQNQYLRVVGLSATPWRMKQGHITDGGVFTDMIIDQTGREAFNWFIAEGYLVKLIPRPTETRLDVTGVSMPGGEYNQPELQRAVDDPETTWHALMELCHYGHDRRCWMIFAAGIDHADHICDMLNKMGVLTTVVHTGIPQGERDKRLKDYQAGKYRCMVGNNILTTGFDHPPIDLIGMFRPTLSPGLWVQMLGRGTRPDYAPGYDLDTLYGRHAAIAASHKQNCIVLDFAQNTANLGPINDPVLPRKAGTGGGDAPVKFCATDRLEAGYKGCGAYNHTMNRHCDECGAPFDMSISVAKTASTQALIAGGFDDFQWFDVNHVFYSQRIGPSGKPYLKVDYWVGPKLKFTDFVHLEATNSFVLHQAKDWWRARSTRPEWGVPPTVAKAIPHCQAVLKRPTKIRVWTNKQPFPEVLNYEYE